jgi:hypothetical protein
MAAILWFMVIYEVLVLVGAVAYLLYKRTR